MSDELAQFQRKSLPAVPGYFVLLGPGLVWMALAQGSGELIWWPYAIAKYGLAFLFLLIPACLLQFPVTFEIGRYTVLTGEGVFKGFFRLNRVFGVMLWLLFTVAFFWFGAFASAGGTAIANLTNFPRGWSAGGQTLFWAQLSIVIFTVAILFARSVYRMIEWVMKVVAIVSLVGMAAACLHPTVRSQVGAFLHGLFVPDLETVRDVELWKPDASMLLTAITFAGLGGFWTLFYSYWVREKGVGMASYAEHITGWRGGTDSIRTGQPALPSDEPEAPARLRKWYRYLSIETLVGIFGNLATTLMTCLLAFALLHPKGLAPEGMRIAVEQAAFFEVTWGQFGRMLFLLIAAAFLADTWLATADCVSRIHLDALTTMFPKIARQDQRKWYYGLVLGGAVLTSLTMYIDQPGPLIIISAIIGFAGTVIYAVALILLNHVKLNAVLPVRLRSGRLSLALIALSTLCYFALAVAYLYVQAPVWWAQLTGAG